jgi:glycosyltransferase involved in cell wall biosynthesis
MSSPAPHVAISAHLLHGQGGYRSAGIHTYIAQTLRHLPQADPALRLTLFTSHPPAGLDRSIDVQTSRWATERPPVRILWEQLRLPGAARRVRAEVLHATAFVAPIAPRCPTVVTIYDLSFALFPQYFRGFNQTYLRAGTRWSAKHARRIIVISEQTKRDVHRLYDVPLDRIDVAYPGVDEALGPAAPEQVAQFKHDKNLPEKYLLFLGTLEPRKNLIMLVQAFAEFKRECPDAVLILAGGVGWLADDLFAAIEQSGVKESIIRPGYVAAEEKTLWYSGAAAFVYPSTYEGFGLPPLEAMACGTPVITSNAASLPEVVGAAGLTIEPDDRRAWISALRRVWTEAAYRAELIDRGLRQAQKFTWPAAAQQIAQSYRCVLG